MVEQQADTLKTALAARPNGSAEVAYLLSRMLPVANIWCYVALLWQCSLSLMQLIDETLLQTCNVTFLEASLLFPEGLRSALPDAPLLL